MRPAKPSAAAAVGRVSNLASGPRIYNLFPLLVGTISAWRAELPRIAAMNFDWVYVNPFHETGGSGSLYAIRDPFPSIRGSATPMRATTTARSAPSRRTRPRTA
jgi:starch synthase (maltosyl-transferring)